MTYNFNQNPYYDDYNEDKKFLRIVFRPGYAVQARELTQLQTIIQNQISRFGKHIFREGAMVVPGGVSIDTNVPYLKLEATWSGNGINVANFVGKKIFGTTSGAIAEVIAGIAAEDGNPDTLMIRYLSGVSSQTATANTVNTNPTITNVTPSLVGKIVPGTRVSGTGIPSNTYVKYFNSNGGIVLSKNCTASNTGVTLTFTTATEFTNNETITTYDSDTVTFEQYSATTKASAATGVGSMASIKEGVYFVNGFFVKVDTQSIVVSKYDNTPSANIGLSVTDMIIDVDDDGSLADPASGSTNYNAPGADRYRIDLTLSAIDYSSITDNNFVSLIKVKDGIVEEQVSVTLYSELEKTLARRTYDESGSYTVKPFGIEVRESLEVIDSNGVTNYGVFDGSTNSPGVESKLAVGLKPGKAYVYGFEIESLATTYLTVDKGRDTLPANNVRINAPMGQYVYVDNVRGTFDITNYQAVDLKEHTDSNSTSAIIGTARVRSFEHYSGTPNSTTTQYKLYLFDIDITANGKTFEDVKYIEVNGAGNAGPSCRPVLEAGIAVLYDPNPLNAAMIFKNPYTYIKTYDPANGPVDTLYDVRRVFTGTTNGSSQLTINTGSDNFSFSSTTTYFHVTKDSDGLVYPVNSVTLGGTNNRQATLNMSGLAGVNVTVIAKISKSVTNHVAAPVKSKTVTSRTQSGLSHGSTVTLDKCDVYQIVSIIDGAAVNVTNRYTLDTGQRDSYYGLSKLVFNSAYAVPTGTLSVTYKYFAHGAGDYFSVDSYSGISYEDIPVYTSSVTGQKYYLADCLDFRPRQSDTGTYSGGTQSLSELPVAYSDIITDFDYYLSRYDKICLDKNGDFFVQRGISAINPIPPKDPDNAMVLYQLKIPPYTTDPSDVKVKYIENKRYTMRDIGKLEKRIENLEYYTTLSLLEKETADMFIDDGTGLNRYKNGFFVENFSTHLNGDTGNADYKAAIDPSNKELRPTFFSNNVGLSLNTTSNVTQTGDLLTLSYTQAEYITQPYASRTYNINEFLLFEWVGSIKLSPDTDYWKDTQQAPDLVVTMDDNFDLLNALYKDSDMQQVVWNSWQTTWTGVPVTSVSTATRTV